MCAMQSHRLPRIGLSDAPIICSCSKFNQMLIQSFTATPTHRFGCSNGKTLPMHPICPTVKSVKAALYSSIEREIECIFNWANLLAYLFVPQTNLCVDLVGNKDIMLIVCPFNQSECDATNQWRNIILFVHWVNVMCDTSEAHVHLFWIIENLWNHFQHSKRSQ